MLCVIYEGKLEKISSAELNKLKPIQFFFENVLNNQKNVVSSNGGYVIEFIDKYIDDNNNKIC